jgi:hypothetical protein
MAARALSHLLSSGTVFSRTSSFYEFAQKTLSLSEEDAKKACTELIMYGAPLPVLGAPSDVVEDAAAKALLCQPQKYMGLADYCPLDARPRILGKAAVEAFCQNDLNGLNAVGVKIEAMQHGDSVYQYIADGVGAWLLAEPRALAFYTRTNVLLTRFRAQTHMSVEARMELTCACMRGGAFNSVGALVENMKQLKVPEVDSVRIIEAICASGRTKLLCEYLDYIKKKPEDVPALLGGAFERVLNHAAAHGKTGILHTLVNENTPVEQLYHPAVCAVRNEQVRVVKLVYQWSNTHEKLKEIVKGVSALLSHHGTSFVYYNKGDTRVRLRGILRALGLGMLPEANSLGESAWVRAFEGVNWDWRGESADAEVERQLLAFFCAREMRVALRGAMSVCPLEREAAALLVPHLPCRTPTSLVMIEDMCGLSECPNLDIDPETALRFLEYAGKHGILMGALRVAHGVAQDSVAALVASALSERNVTRMHVYQLTNPSSVEAALSVHDESPERQDEFHTWLHQRVPGIRWSPPVYS